MTFDYGIEDVPEADDAAIDRWHDDADTHDVFIQHVLFGEVIYG